MAKKDLQKEKQQLKLYVKLLPSIDLKRTQLTAEYTKANKELLDLRTEYEAIVANATENIPMLANNDVKLEGLVKIGSIVIGEESLVGVKVPVLKEFTFQETSYSMLATPFWIEIYIKQLKKAIDAKMRIQLMEQRVKNLSSAVRKVTQHVNLFEKILIPNAKKNIQKIQIILGEAERNAVVRAKLAKALHTRSPT
jgi:V/A-type H+-transporting ATPase subunit D